MRHPTALRPLLCGASRDRRYACASCHVVRLDARYQNVTPARSAPRLRPEHEGVAVRSGRCGVFLRHVARRTLQSPPEPSHTRRRPSSAAGSSSSSSICQRNMCSSICKPICANVLIGCTVPSAGGGGLANGMADDAARRPLRAFPWAFGPRTCSWGRPDPLLQWGTGFRGLSGN